MAKKLHGSLLLFCASVAKPSRQRRIQWPADFAKTADVFLRPLRFLRANTLRSNPLLFLFRTAVATLFAEGGYNTSLQKHHPAPISKLVYYIFAHLHTLILIRKFTFTNTANMYRQIIIPSEKEHSIELPENLYGKQVEITVNEIVPKMAKAGLNKKLPARLKNKAFWENIEYVPGFPSVEEIRQTAWPKKK